jgi:hypothetical protein
MELTWGIAAIGLGLALAGVFARQRDTVRRLRTTVFASLTRFFLGSTTDRVSEHCHCSVMIVK